MTKYTIKRNILIAQMFFSALILGAIIYYIHPFIEKNNGLAGTYYVITTLISIVIGLIVEAIMLAIFEYKKNKAEKEAMESTPTEEHADYKEKLAKINQNKKINEYRSKFDTNL